VEELKAAFVKQEATNAQQQKEIKALTANIKQQAAAIQSVNARLEANKLSPQVVTNDR